MAIIDFSKFNQRPLAITGNAGKAAKNLLVGNLKKYLLNNVSDAKRELVAEKLKTIAIDLDAVKEKPLSLLIDDLLLENFEDNDEMKGILTELSQKLKGNTPNVGALVGLDLPLKDNPALVKEYNVAKTKAFGEIIHLPATVIDKLLEGEEDIDDLGDGDIKKFSDDQLITDVQSRALKLVIDLSRLSGANIDFIKAFHHAEATVEDFILNDAEDWKKVLTAKHIPVPEGEKSIDSYAKNLARNMELSFPKTFFLSRINKEDFTNELKTFKAIEKMSRLGRITYKGSNIVLDDIRWTGVSAEEKKQLQKDIQDLQAFAHTYRYLDITEILANDDMNNAAKTEAVKKRLDQLNRFYKSNEQLDLMQVDFFDPGVKPDYTGVDEKNRSLVRKQAMAYQRMQHLSGRAKTTQQLLAKGYSSSWDIIEVGEKGFISATDLKLNEAKEVYTSALNTVTATSHFVQAIRDSQQGGFTALAVNNMGQMVNDLRAIDGYSELFGNQDFCECDHCKSIFSPAAYFTDLMLFIEKNVSRKYFTGTDADSSLKLRNRRSDLWSVALSCQNTSTEIPYLDVVNDVLEQYIKSGLEDGSEVYDELSNSEESPGLPFNLPLEELRTYLKHFGLSLSQLYTLLNEPAHKQAQEKLLLSDKELLIIGTPNPANVLRKFGNPPNLAKLSVSDFIRLAAISRADLDELIAVTSIPELENMDTRVVESPEDIQQYKELFTAASITPGNLDIVNRYLRLWKKTPWSICEFDTILVSLGHVDLFSNLEEKDAEGQFKILVLADVITIQNSLKLSVEELCGIIDDLPEAARNANESGLYRRLFNVDKILTGAAPTLSNIKAEDTITPYLLTGLSINEQELNMLFALLGIDNINALVPLNKLLLSRLYRQTQVSVGLKLNIEAFVAAVKVCIGTGEISSVNQVIQLIDDKRWIDSSPFKFQQLDFILNGAISQEIKYNYTNQKVKGLVAEMKNIIAPGTEIEIAILYNKLQALFNITTEQLITYRLFIPIFDEVIIKAALNSDIEIPDNLNPVVELFNQLERRVLCFDRLKWSYDEVLILKEHPAVFGMADLVNWSLDNIKAMVSFNNLFINLPEEVRTSIRMMLKNNASVNNLMEADVQLFAATWSFTPSLLHSIINNISFTGTLTADLERLFQFADICNTLGIQGDSLIKLRETTYKGLVAANNVVYGAFASKYADEKIRAEKLEAYHDRINTLKRDALCDFIIAQRDRFNFKDWSDLYNFFLLDVEMSGCFRTSKLLAAISSTQLYIHRCLLNLERFETDIAIAVSSGSIPADEWEWRKNYRVWEANRKVFLYPENYIDPALRDTKTTLFKELEDELLQQNISMDSAEAAYKKYLAQFLELSHLRYAGAYYHVVDNSPFKDVLVTMPSSTTTTTTMATARERITVGSTHSFKDVFVDKDKTAYYLFARTHLQPFQYYYRTFYPYKNLWGDWQKIDVPIEAEEISSIIHNGKLHIYWTESQHKEITTISGGDASSSKVVFKVTVKYTGLDANNKWATPQRLYLGSEVRSDQQIADRLRLEVMDDNKKDLIIEKFKQEVFRKPYVSRTEEQKRIDLRHIYTPGKYVQQLRYRTREVDQVRALGLLQLQVQVPSRVIVVTNGRFGQRDSFEFNEARITITLNDASSATVQYVKYGIPYTFLVRVDLGNELLERVWLTKYQQDIYKYINEPDRKFFNHSSDQFIENSFFNTEYLSAFNESDRYVHFVEDGSRNFLKGKKILKQYKKGQAHLEVTRAEEILTIPLSTILSDELNIRLTEKGLETFLSLSTQKMSDSAGQRFDFSGSYGAYYWELFFHIPFLIANHLNANQDFEGAKWWYERIFNPTSSEKPDPAKPAEHNWQFCKFRNLDITRLKDILSDEATIAIYNNDPFDPHAIARLRISAYQKSIVMKYIDNLLDWGDFLFTKDTQESIVEADMLYQLAQDILGKRPERTGKCRTENDEELTFDKIISSGDGDSEFFINLENVYLRVQRINTNDRAVLERSKYLSKLLEELGDEEATPNTFSDWVVLSNATYHADLRMAQGSSVPVAGQETATAKPKIAKYSELNERGYKPSVSKPKIQVDINSPDIIAEYGYGHDRLPATDITNNLAFCVPVNVNLIEYWDRLADRLFKIRNCMNISGVRRSLALYQPPIDPMLLVRAKAAGLSLKEILAGSLITVVLPSYRFVYMLEKAKQFAQNVQGFGSALLSALEKKDGEELTLLRSVNERNILRLTKDIKSKQVQEAQKQYISVEESITNIQNRILNYGNLIDEGLTGWEVTQQVTKHAATMIQSTSTAFYGSSSVFALLPQLGSPFSINWGGKQLSEHWDMWGKFLSANASILESVSASAGLEASFQRRKEEWSFQLQTAEQEIKQAIQQLLAADLRVKIVERDLEIHEKTIEQSMEVHEFFQGKFTNLGLYSYMATSLNRLYRTSYSMAFDMAKQAEQCYKYETFDEATFVGGDIWQNDRTGLLAGEGLMLQLNQMEQRYMDQYKRCPEITQSFSFALIDPGELLKLKQTGKCMIKIPEILYDILYPGQYRRLIRGVRISIPCIVGPFTNISANLRLIKSEVRVNEDDEILRENTPIEIPAITTSSAMNDSGTFEFSFRDERYLPFEYAGAISEWELNLPSKIRSFNYNSISDVIMHVSYTSQEGKREAGEEKVLGAFEAYAEEKGLFKLISLKYEFPDEFHRLLNSDIQLVEFELTDDFFPYFLINKTLSTTEVKVYLKPKKNMAVAVPDPGVMKINEVSSVWEDEQDIATNGDTSENDKIKGGTIEITGSPLKKWKIDAGSNGLNKESIDDLLILIKYKTI